MLNMYANMNKGRIPLGFSGGTGGQAYGNCNFISRNALARHA